MPGIASVTVIFSVCGTYPRYVPPRATVALHDLGKIINKGRILADNANHFLGVLEIVDVPRLGEVLWAFVCRRVHVNLPKLQSHSHVGLLRSSVDYGTSTK